MTIFTLLAGSLTDAQDWVYEAGVTVRGAIVDSALNGRGLTFTVVMARQAGKNELSASETKASHFIAWGPSASCVMRSAARNASAWMVIVGWPRPEVTKLLPSQMKRFGTSCDR